MHKIVFIRHGQSQWNLENRFTGWTDIDLTEKGREEAKSAGALLEAEGFQFDCAFSSVLTRAIRTLWLVLDEMNLLWLPIERSWKLNERHYGALQGLNKAETAKKYGDEQVHIWRRSYSTPPPALEPSDERHPSNDLRYSGLNREELPLTESLKETVARTVPYWNQTIAPKIKEGKKVIVAAHGNSLRALVKHFDQISDEDIAKLNIPTGVPLVYEFNSKLEAQKSYYLES